MINRRNVARMCSVLNTCGMQVILLRDVAGVGQRGSVKNVADGYALNHLIPNKMAQLATTEALKTLEKRNADEKAHRAEQEKHWAAIVGKMKGFTLMVRANANNQGHLYKKITAEDIVRVLGEQGIDVPIESVQPKMAIKETGTWPVQIRLGNQEATITVDVIAT
jgi:large subunit ribosomal protein L9